MRCLRLDVNISYVPITGLEGTYPVLKCSDFLKYMDRYSYWDKVLGVGVRRLDDARERLEDFWTRHKRIHPLHPVHQRAASENIPLSRVIPIMVHGDEGSHYKKQACMVLQWQGCLGAGTMLNRVELDIDGNLAGKSYGANQVGITLSTRFLFTVMPKDAIEFKSRIILKLKLF